VSRRQGGRRNSRRTTRRPDIEPTDEHLLIAWFLGDAAAFATFYGRHHPRTVSWLKARGLAGPLADDVAQDAFLRLHASIGTYDRTRPALPWFFTIVRSSLIDFLRRENRQAARARAWGAEAGADAMRPSGDEEEAVRRLRVERVLASLPEEQRAFVRARIFDDVGYATLAERSGKSESSLRKAFERLMRKLSTQAKEGR
jgi:RNA polymerase sigma factor (sigma-70 family)